MVCMKKIHAKPDKASFVGAGIRIIFEATDKLRSQSMSAALSRSMINCQPAAPTHAARAVALMCSVRETARLWAAQFSQRHTFPAVGERELRDLGISRLEFEHELKKPFWRG